MGTPCNRARGKVSIVIPCHNDGVYLKDALASVTQARCDVLHETIIVNDGSTDPETLEILAAASSQGFKVLNQENKGLGTARNNGINQCTGEYILPLDSDNRITDVYLKSAPELFSRDPGLGVVYGNLEYFGEKAGVWVVPNYDPATLVLGNYIDACAVFRHAAWESVNGYDEHMPVMGYEDWDLWLRLTAKGWGFKHLGDVAFHYRVRKSSMITETTRNAELLRRYIFRKEENGALLVRMCQTLHDDLNTAKQQVKNLGQSWEFRCGSILLKPARAVQRALKNNAGLVG